VIGLLGKADLYLVDYTRRNHLSRGRLKATEIAFSPLLYGIASRIPLKEFCKISGCNNVSSMNGMK
jgi:hypothetical protein